MNEHLYVTLVWVSAGIIILVYVMFLHFFTRRGQASAARDARIADDARLIQQRVAELEAESSYTRRPNT
jgi:F0F1-type ATP synthase membrane subunit b/b'